MTAYGMRTTLKTSFAEAVTRVTDALKVEGFGVLTQIDVRDTLKKKLDVEFPSYLILGACNPRLSHRALTAEQEIGLLLPCNVIVYQGKTGEIVVAAQDPDVMLSIVPNPEIAAVAKEARERLGRVIASLG